MRCGNCGAPAKCAHCGAHDFDLAESRRIDVFQALNICTATAGELTGDLCRRCQRPSAGHSVSCLPCGLTVAASAFTHLCARARLHDCPVCKVWPCVCAPEPVTR